MDDITEDEKKYFIEYFQQSNNDVNVNDNDEHQSKKQRYDNHDYQVYLNMKVILLSTIFRIISYLL